MFMNLHIYIHSPHKRKVAATDLPTFTTRSRHAAAVHLPSELHSNPMLLFSFTCITTHTNALPVCSQFELAVEHAFPKILTWKYPNQFL